VLDAIAGSAPAGDGSIVLDGGALEGLRAAGRRKAGIGRVFQTPRLAGPTPMDDVVLGARSARGLLSGLVRRPARAALERSEAALLEVGLDPRTWSMPVAQLGLPDQRRVELARALAGDPCLLLLDEPASGLPSEERDRFAEMVVGLAGPDRGVILVEHDMELVARAAHHVIALDRGRVVKQGSFAAVAADPTVRTSYLGEGSRAVPRAAAHAGATPVLSVRGLRASHGSIPALHGLDIDVAAGEVVAVLGPNGAGKSTLARCLSGLHREMEGVISVDGRELARGDAVARGAARLAAVSDTRDLVPALTVDRYLDLVLDEAGRARANELFERLRALGNRRCAQLSGGEAQLVALARALGARPSALVIDELSQGLAPVTLNALLPAVRACADDGCAVLLIEQFAVAAAVVADRVVMLENGRIVYDGAVGDAPIASGYLRPDDATPPPPTVVLADVTMGLLPAQRRALADLSSRSGTPPGQLVRDAIDAMLASADAAKSSPASNGAGEVPRRRGPTETSGTAQSLLIR
jgi:ABC-type branched-subunit amino acid transport system ATPase component